MNFDYKLSRHATERCVERSIPPQLIAKTIKTGNRCINLFKNTVSHKLKVVVNNKKRNLIVVTGLSDNSVVTCYFERVCKIGY